VSTEESPEKSSWKEVLQMASQFISNAIKDSFEMNCHIKLMNSLTCGTWWSKKLSKLGVEVRKPFNWARSTCQVGD
jgi:hypothetical protein